MRSSVVLLLVAMIGCGGRSEPASPPVAPAAPAASRDPAPALDPAAVTTMSRKFLELVDKRDHAFTGQLGATFVWFESQRAMVPEHLLRVVKGRQDRNAPLPARTWDEKPHILISSSAAVYIGAVTTRFDPAKPEDEEQGWYTFVWVPDGVGWKLAHLQYQRGGIEAQREMWNDRYSRPSGFKLEPNQLLVDAVKGRPPGRALDLGSGQGRNLVFLARQGWKATGVDLSNVGHRVAQETAAKHNVAIETIEADLSKWDFGKDKWDLVAMIYLGHDEAIAERAKASIKKKGLFVTEFFSADSVSAKSGIGGWSTSELAAMFKDGWTILRNEVVEDVADWSLTRQRLVRFVAEKQ